MPNHILVIAEPGCTHGGNLEDMRRLIQVAAQAGADVCKFQWTSSAERMCQRRHAPEYLEAYRLIQFPVVWLDVLDVACKEAGIRFGCSVYLPEDVLTLSLRTKFIKVASFEAQDQELLAECERLHVKPIISVGMLDEDSVFNLDEWAYEYSGTRLLHCVSAYPCSIQSLNLRVIREHSFNGLSDHSCHVLTGALAVAAGAEIIETHFRLDDCPPDNPDYAHALTPAQFKEYVANIRLAEQAMGDGKKIIQECEKPMLKYRVQT